MKKASALTVGCRLNQADTGLIFNRLETNGYKIVPPDDDGPIDVFVINSCSVTNTATQKSRQAARRMAKKHPESLIVVTGCSTETEKEFWEKNSSRYLIIPNSEKSDIIKFIDDFSLGETEIVTGKFGDKKIFKEKAISVYPFRHRVLVKIQEGCNAFCSYCVVPYGRGRERSRDRKEIICEIRRHIDDGCKEIVLTGVNISTYRHGPTRLPDLLAELADLSGTFRIRLSSTEPHPDNKEIIDVMAENRKICRFLHLPLQHGSDEILQAMNRNYSTEEFADFAQEALKKIPGLHLGTDFIVGFPGETDFLFNQALKLIDNISFANMHIFSFSPRPGTPAANFPDRVTHQIAKERYRILSEVSKKMAENFIKSQLGKELVFLIEKTTDNNIFEGWSDNYIRGRIFSENNAINEFVRINFSGRNILK